MARLGFVGRIALIVLCASFAILTATFGIGTWQRTQESVVFPGVPLLDRAAAVASLLDRTPPADRSLILRAVGSEPLRIWVEPTMPVPPLGMQRSPSLEWALRGFLDRRQPDWELTAYVPSEDAQTGALGGALVDRLLRVVVPLGNGGFAVLETSGRMDVLLRRAFGIPPGFWVAVIGFVVAALALLAAVREARPLRRLAQSISLFDGSIQTAVPETGAPEIRRLINSVNGMQQRIAALLAERSILIGSISHDLKTFLTRLRLRVEAMEDNGQRERAISDLDQMSVLLDEALAFARGTTVSERRRAVDVVDLAAIEVAEHEARGAPVELAAPPNEPVMVECDPIALRRVLANVLGNATAYATRTEVAVRAQGHVCRITVDDDGPGIPDAERTAIFNAFYRVDGSRNRATGGSGLGLAIAKQIVEAHGGTISASRSPLGGARLTIELPVIVSPRAGGAAGLIRPK